MIFCSPSCWQPAKFDVTTSTFRNCTTSVTCTTSYNTELLFFPPTSDKIVKFYIFLPPSRTLCHFQIISISLSTSTAGCNINRSVLLAQIPNRHQNKALSPSSMHQMPHSRHQHTPHCYNTNRNVELRRCSEPLANLKTDTKKPAGSTISCAYH